MFRSKDNNLILLICITVILAGCFPKANNHTNIGALSPTINTQIITINHQNSTPTRTSKYYNVTKDCVVPTLLENRVCPCGCSEDPPLTTIVAPSHIIPKLELPGPLFIEEYPMGNNYSLEEILQRHPNKGGWYFWPKGGNLDGKLFQTEETSGEINAYIDGKLVFTAQCEISPNPSIITAWTYETHWIIQTYCHQNYDIIIDGEFINEKFNYQSSYAFQLMDGKPFYLFTKNGTVWVKYIDKEIDLGVEIIPFSYCCDGQIPPQHYERLIHFDVMWQDKNYIIVIGID